MPNSASPLSPATPAPDFSGPIQDGSTRSLADYRGKRLALYFYPKDMTPGCTAQACNLTENFDALADAGISILGVSPDPVAKHVKFTDKHGLRIELLADEDLAVHKAFGVWGLKKFMGREYEGTHRTTFLINKDGVIDHVISKPKTKDHAAEILALWK